MLTTARLLLRDWRDDDLDALAAINGDPHVMRHFPRKLTRAESWAALNRMRDAAARAGFGMRAVEADGRLVGIAGLQWAPAELPFAPVVEAGWRFAADVWGRGYAPEAAAAAIADGFANHGIAEIVALTATGNAPSRRVMDKLGMVHDPDADFDHPLVPEGHAVRPHVLYRLRP